MLESSLDQGQDRPYKCPCGKNYLSYPALFTHVKQKHHGKPPGEIIRPKAANKRGRPRKNPNEAPEQAPPIPQQPKISLQRFNNQNDEDSSYLELMREKARKHPKRSFDFIPPLSFNSKTPEPGAVKLESLGQGPHPQLQKKIFNFFLVLNSQTAQSFLSSEGIQNLILANEIYKTDKTQERCLSRRPIGMDQEEMEFRTALLLFLDWCKTFLPLQHFKNFELLISLLSYFYSSMIPQVMSITTTNYLFYLNLFAKTLFNQLPQMQVYNKASILHKQGSILKALTFIQEWLVLEGLCFFNVEINPKWE